MTDEIRWLLLCAALAAGEALGCSLGRFAPLGPLVFGATVLVGLFGYGLRARGWLVAVVFGLGLALSLRTEGLRAAVLHDVHVRHCGRPYAAVFDVEGPVGVRAGTDGTCWASFRSRLGPVPVRVICPAPNDAPPQVGERWRCSGWLARTPEGAGGRYAFWVRGTGTSAARMDAQNACASVLRREAKAALSTRLGCGLAASEAYADLHRAILLGERERLGHALKDDFVAAGTIHIFAISGLHVVIIAQALALVLTFTGLPVRLSGLVKIPLLWAYAFLVGLPPSAVRATTMLTLCYLAPLAWRRPNGITAWALTFLGVYGLSPERIQDVGCWMSFAVMLVLVAWGRWGVATGSRFLDFLVFTATAWMASLPIAAHVFGRVTPGGLLANVLVAPLATGTVLGSAGGVLASFVSEDLASVVNNLTASCTEVMVDVSRAVAAVPGSSVEIEPWSLGGCLLWYAGLFAGLAFLHRWATRPRIFAAPQEERGRIMRFHMI